MPGLPHGDQRLGQQRGEVGVGGAHIQLAPPAARPPQIAGGLRGRLRRLEPLPQGQLQSQAIQGHLPVFLLAPPLVCLGDHPAGEVCQHHGGLDLVAVLPPRARTPREPEVAVSQQPVSGPTGRMGIGGGAGGRHALDYSDRRPSEQIARQSCGVLADAAIVLHRDRANRICLKPLPRPAFPTSQPGSSQWAAAGDREGGRCHGRPVCLPDLESWLAWLTAVRCARWAG